MTLYDEMRIANAHKGQRYSSGAKAVQDQRNVGALQINHLASDDKKKPRTGADQPTQGIGPWADGDRYGNALENIKKGTKGIGPVKDGDKYAKSLKSGLTANKLIAGAGHLQSILEGADKLFGEGEIIGMGSGYAMQQGGYNPEMYIGQGVGY